MVKPKIASTKFYGLGVETKVMGIFIAFGLSYNQLVEAWHISYDIKISGLV